MTAWQDAPRLLTRGTSWSWYVPPFLRFTPPGARSSPPAWPSPRPRYWARPSPDATPDGCAGQAYWQPVSYTHLDVYKRQPCDVPTIANGPFVLLIMVANVVAPAL